MPPFARVDGQPAGGHRGAQPGPVRLGRRADTVGGVGGCARREVVEVGAHVDWAAGGVDDRHIHRPAGLVTARIRAGPGHPRRVRHRLEHPHLHLVRPVAVPEHQLLALRAQRGGRGGQAGRHRLVHQAAGVGGIQLRADEVVRGGVAQVEHGVGHHRPHVEETDGRRRGAHRRHPGVRGGLRGRGRRHGAEHHRGTHHSHSGILPYPRRPRVSAMSASAVSTATISTPNSTLNAAASAGMTPRSAST